MNTSKLTENTFTAVFTQEIRVSRLFSMKTLTHPVVEGGWGNHVFAHTEYIDTPYQTQSMSLSRLFSEVQPPTQEPEVCGSSRPLSGLFPPSSLLLRGDVPSNVTFVRCKCAQKGPFRMV